jgi:transcriptional regulator with XRE-family HTH domain
MISKMKIERIKRDLSQRELAEVSAVGVGDVSRIETGRMAPYPRQAARIAAVLGLTVDELQKPIELEEAVAK